MLCFLTAGKSSTSWLDRLHTSKGFPLPHHDLPLDHFLNQNPSTDPLPPLSADANVSSDDPDRTSGCDTRPAGQQAGGDDGGKEEEQDQDLFDLMSCALAELFNMGDPEEYERARRHLRDRRSARKQLNPKICVLSNQGSDDGSCPAGKGRACGEPAALSPSSAENSTVGAKKRARCKLKVGKKRGTGVVRPADPEQAPCSRTDVTVIDTSCSPGWKSAMIILRRGPVWKVRDKKLWNLSRKKRKLSLAEKLVGEEGNEGKPFEDRNEQMPPLNDEFPCDEKGDSSKRVLDHQIPIIEQSENHISKLQFSRSCHRPGSKEPSIFPPQTPVSRKAASSLSKGALRGK